MGGKVSAEYYREYRRKNRERLRASERTRNAKRRLDPAYRVEKNAREVARRRKLRQDPARRDAFLEANRRYLADWRARNPGYHVAWRARKYAALRAAHAEATAALHAPPYTGHPIFEHARTFVRNTRFREHDDRYDPIHEDATAEAVLALLEQRDPEAAVKRFYRTEYVHRRLTTPFFDYQ